MKNRQALKINNKSGNNGGVMKIMRNGGAKNRRGENGEKNLKHQAGESGKRKPAKI